VPVSGNHRKLLFLPTAAIMVALTFSTFTAGPALAAPAHSVQSTAVAVRAATTAKKLPARLRAYRWAKTQDRKPYIFGGTGPRGYDCSGLVMMAYRKAGIRLPRTTYGMLASKLLVRVRHPVRGDLAFYGSGHVEIYVRGDYTFGAHSSGQLIGWIKFGPWWHPTAYYRVR
jgi:cell wall-associated NlpC family hydrolase